MSALLGATALTTSAASFDWPQWQGPDRNAISKETGLLQEWPKAGPPLAWKITGLGGGDSAPVIAAGRVFGMGNRGEDEVVWALSEKEGKELWVTRLGAAVAQGMPQSKEGPGCTPTVDGDRLYVLGMGGSLACLQAADGKVVWQLNLVTDFGGIVPTWSYRESPLIDGDKLICTPGGDDALLVALDKLTGKTLWKSRMPGASADANAAPAGPGAPGARGGAGVPTGAGGPAAGSAATLRVKAGMSAPFTDSGGQVWQPDSGFEGGMGSPGTFAMAGNPTGSAGADRGAAAGGRGGRGGQGGGRGGFGGPRSGAGYASVIAIAFEGQRQYVQLTANALVGVAASDGKFLWRYERPANRMGINCSTPLYHDGMVFAASAYGAGGGLVKLSKTADGGVKAEEVWSSRNMENHHGGVVLVDGCLYGSNGGNGGGYLVCLDFKTGEVLWNERDQDKRRVPKGSVSVADGRLYYRTEDGTVLLIEPSRKEYLERGRFEQPDRSRPPAWAHPVIANGKLYIRDQGVLFCYNVMARGQ